MSQKFPLFFFTLESIYRSYIVKVLIHQIKKSVFLWCKIRSHCLHLCFLTLVYSSFNSKQSANKERQFSVCMYQCPKWQSLQEATQIQCYFCKRAKNFELLTTACENRISYFFSIRLSSMFSLEWCVTILLWNFLCFIRSCHLTLSNFKTHKIINLLFSERQASTRVEGVGKVVMQLPATKKTYQGTSYIEKLLCCKLQLPHQADW